MVNCTKRHYSDRKIAKKELKRLKKEGAKLTAVYKCTLCGYFHLTSMDKAIGRKTNRYFRDKNNCK